MSKNKLKNNLNNKIKIGVSGDLGSFSETAALDYINKNKLSAELDYLIDMEGVLANISNHKIDLGIFPVVNTAGGLVEMAFTAMGKYLFNYMEYFWLDVHQCLLILPEDEKLEIKYIYSHPQGFAQCKNYLKNNLPQAELIIWDDTAKAAKDLSGGKLPKHSAAIAPKRCAEIYKLKVLAEDIQDQKPNLTGFIVVKPHSEFIL